MEQEKNDKNDPSANRPDKCKTCYLVECCMLTAKMSLLCGGPFKDAAARLLFIKEQIQEKKLKKNF